MFVHSGDKGAVAELRIAAEATRLGVVVSRPLSDGRRYDLVFDIAHRLYRVQCKWGRLCGDVIVVRTGTCRHSPTRGYVRTTYDASELELFAVYCGALDRILLVPVAEAGGHHELRLRIAPAKNNQRVGVRMAEQYDLPGAIAQLEERVTGSHEVGGSSPPSSTRTKAA